MLCPVTLMLMLISLTCGENPAIQVILTDKGLQYGKHVGAGWIQDRFSHVTLPDISGKVLGCIYYTLSGTTITKSDFPEPSVEFYQDATGLKTSISGLCVALTGEWMTHFGMITDGGTFDMAIFSIDVTSVVKLGKDADGHLSITSVKCGATVGDVDVRFHGGASWFFQPFVEHFKGRIVKKIESAICPYVKEFIVTLEYHLQAMKVSIDVGEYLTLDLPLTGEPIVDASKMNLDLKGEFYNSRGHKEPPFVAQPFTVPEQPDRMLSVGLSEFTLNSASYVLHSAGLLQAVINDSMIPSYFHFRLNTSSMGSFIPQLPKMYPGLLMTLLVYSREIPMFSFQPEAVKLDVQGTVKAFAIQPNGTQIPLFKLNVDTDWSSKVWLADGRLKGFVTQDNFTLTLASTEVGDFKTEALEGAIEVGLKVALAKLNVELGKGVELPRMKHVQLNDVVLGMKKGFIVMSSNAQVLPRDADFS